MNYSQKNTEKSTRHLKYKLIYSLSIVIMILSYISALSGCATTEPQRIKTENTVYKMNYEILSVTMKNGAVIDLRNTPARYLKKYKDEKNVILYTSLDTLQISNDSIYVFQKTEIIKLDEVQRVTTEKNRDFQISLFY
jgi:hypothetical protein